MQLVGLAEVVSCGLLPTPSHGQWNASECNGTDLLYPTACELLCDEGYVVSGDEVVVCGSEGLFSPSEMPVCEGKSGARVGVYLIRLVCCSLSWPVHGCTWSLAAKCLHWLRARLH